MEASSYFQELGATVAKDAYSGSQPFAISPIRVGKYIWLSAMLVGAPISDKERLGKAGKGGKRVGKGMEEPEKDM